MARKSRGRQKIEMAKMTNESNLQVTFSKRRFGLFKKASELITLCGVEVGLIIFSPGQKVYTFGHPNVETIVERFINGHSYHLSQINSDRLAEAHRTITIMELMNDITNKENLIENEKKKFELISQKLENCSLYNRWWSPSVDELSLQELEEFKIALEGLKKDVDERANELTVQINSNTTNSFNLDSGILGKNFTPFTGFNRSTLPFAGHENSVFTSMIHQNLGLSSLGTSSMAALGLDLGVGTSSRALGFDLGVGRSPLSLGLEHLGFGPRFI